MRILHVTDCYLPRLGGIETHVQDLVTQQRAEGHDAGVLTLTPAGGDAADPEWVTRVAYPRVSVTGPAHATRQVLDLLAGADVVHAHVSVVSPFTSGGPAGRRAQRPHAGHRALAVVPPRCAADPRAAWPSGWPGGRAVVGGQRGRRGSGPPRLGAEVPVLVLPNAVDPARWQVPHRAAGRPRCR